MKRATARKLTYGGPQACLDLSGNGKDGVPIGGVSWDQIQGAVFSATAGEYITLGTVAEVGLNIDVDDEWSIAFWVDLDNLAALRGLFGHGAFGLDGWYAYHTSTGEVTIRNNTGGVPYNTSTGAGALTAGRHHILLRQTATVQSIFIDGVDETTIQTSTRGDATSTGRSVIIGSYSVSSGAILGSMSSVRIYNRAISDSEAAELANGHEIDSSALVLYHDYTRQHPSCLLAVEPRNPCADKSGLGNDGTPTAVEFDTVNGAVIGSTDSYINCGNDASLQISSGDITYAAWIKASDSSYKYIIAKRNNTVGAYSLSYDINGKLQLVGGISGTGAASNTAVNDNTWHHVAVTVNGTTVTFYLDGTPDGSYTLAAVTLTESVNLLIGIRDEYSSSLNGDMREAWVYGRALSPSEISDLANNLPVSSTNLVLHHDYRTNAPVDLSPTGAKLTLNGCTPQPDGTLLFDGAGQYASVPDCIPVDESWWAECWLDPDAIGTYPRIFDTGSAYWALKSSDSNMFASADVGATDAYSGINSIATGIWQHLAVSMRYDSGDGHMYASFYINGVQSGTEQDAGVPSAGTTDLFIGNRAAGDRTFDGQLQTPRIFRGEATVADIIARADERCPAGVAPSWMLGPELVTNGDFSDGTTGWTLGDGWSISGGLAVAVETSGSIYQSIASHVTGNVYRVVCGVVEIPIAGFRPILGGALGITNNSIGQSVDILSTVSSDKNIYLDAGISAGSVSLNNVSCRRLISPLAAAVASIS